MIKGIFILTNAMCTGQITSNWFESIHICSIRTMLLKANLSTDMHIILSECVDLSQDLRLRM